MVATLATTLIILSTSCAFISSRSAYIINGQAVDTPGKYPWQAALFTASGLNCGASLIHRRWLLTAAHCCKPNVTAHSVTLGLHDKQRLQGGPHGYSVDKIIVHPDYKGAPNWTNDIALIKLTTPAATHNNFVQIISLNEARDAFLSARARCVITGWGYVLGQNGNREKPNVLQEADTTITTETECNKYYNYTRDKICVQNGRTNTCSGDSGGPLACKLLGQPSSPWKLVGVASYGKPGCRVDRPKVFQRVSHHNAWIQRVMARQ